MINTLQSNKYIRTYVALERSIYIDENTRESMSILPVSFVSLTATQKSWRGLGSEAEATENAVAKSTMCARLNPSPLQDFYVAVNDTNAGGTIIMSSLHSFCPFEIHSLTYTLVFPRLH